MRRSLLPAFVFMLSSVAAQAAEQRWPLWYLGLGGGLTFVDDVDVGGTSTGETQLDVGGHGTLALGYMPPASFQPFSNMRFEAELGYYYNSQDVSRLGSGALADAGGHLQTVTAMINAYYDFRNDSQWTPYLGGGIGGAKVNLSRDSGLNNTTTNDKTWAYQFMGGVTYAPTTMPMVEWGMGYRYLSIASPEFRANGGGRVELDDLATHHAEVSGRFRF